MTSNIKDNMDTKIDDNIIQNPLNSNTTYPKIKKKKNKQNKQKKPKNADVKINIKRTLKKNKNKKQKQKHTKKIGSGVVDYITDKTFNKLFRWLRGRANIFTFSTFENSKDVYLSTLFIFLRYRTNVQTRSIYQAFKKGNLKDPTISKLVRKKKSIQLINNITELHDLIDNISSFNSLCNTNKLCLKNSICIGVIETLRFMGDINSIKSLCKFYDRIILVLTKMKDSLIFNKDSEFEKRFRVNYENTQHLNFRVINSYDYGLIYNILNFGLFYHNRRLIYAEKYLEKPIKKTSILIEKEKELHKRRYHLQKLLNTYYNKSDKVLPNPNVKATFIGNSGHQQDNIIKKLSTQIYSKNQNQKTNNTNTNTNTNITKVDADKSANKTFNAYINLLKEFHNLEIKNDRYNISEIDELENKTSLTKKSKDLYSSILDLYSKDTIGLFKGNLSESIDILDNVRDFPERFVTQIESAAIHLDFINFNVA